ncbi:CE1 family esterase [Ketobacter sp.]
MLNAAALATLSVTFWGCGAADEGVDAGCLEKMDFPAAAYDWVKVNCPANSYRLTVPETCESGGCGVILDVHGGSMNAGSENAGTNLSELGTNAVSFGASTPYIVVQPSAPDTVWAESGANDKSVYGFLESVVNVFNADTDRVHMGGFSQGSSMTWRFMCKYPDTFASLAPIAGINPNNQGTLACEFPQIPILYVNGKSDPLAVYANEAVPLLATVREAIGAENLEEIVLDEGEKHQRIRLSGDGYLLEHISHTSNGIVGGHCLPGGSGLLGCSGSFNYGEEALKFYIAHPKP